MKIRKIKALYTIKTKDKKIPKGVYSVDSPGGIPEVLIQEAERGCMTVQVLEYDHRVEKVNEAQGEGSQGDGITMLDEGDGAVNLEEKEKPEPKKKLVRKRTAKKE